MESEIMQSFCLPELTVSTHFIGVEMLTYIPDFW